MLIKGGFQVSRAGRRRSCGKGKGHSRIRRHHGDVCSGGVAGRGCSLLCCPLSRSLASRLVWFTTAACRRDQLAAATLWQQPQCFFLSWAWEGDWWHCLNVFWSHWGSLNHSWLWARARGDAPCLVRTQPPSCKQSGSLIVWIPFFLPDPQCLKSPVCLIYSCRCSPGDIIGDIQLGRVASPLKGITIIQSGQMISNLLEEIL